ncbi:hypothetical protein [Micromonospora sp. NPDC050276]|uniref:hypothetical protein n=1 Tax=Micromonospora sp. NPDC050276 TaxID=3364278 RepID=UPI00379FCAA9
MRRDPTDGQWRRLSIISFGVVDGFPLFTSLALTTQTSAHGAVAITVLPVVTAAFAVLTLIWSTLLLGKPSHPRRSGRWRCCCCWATQHT